MLPDARRLLRGKPAVADRSVAQRDRRWCQGNLQHSRVLRRERLLSRRRANISLTGIFGYLTSPLWLVQLLVGIVLVFQASYIRPEYFTKEFTLFPAWPRFDAERSLELFASPWRCCSRQSFSASSSPCSTARRRRGSGGVVCLLVSTLFEVMMSALLAPIMMLIQTGHVLHILFGFDTGLGPAAARRRHRCPLATSCVAIARMWRSAY